MNIPETIQSQMKLKGIKTLRSLAIQSGLDPMTVHRMFSGKNQHKALVTYKRIADTLQWSLETFFQVSECNQPEAIGLTIRARLKQLEIPTTQFASVVDTAGGSNGFKYLRGDIGFDRLRIYASVRTALGITCDALYESFVMSGCLTATGTTAILSPSVGLSHNLTQRNLKKTA